MMRVKKNRKGKKRGKKHRWNSLKGKGAERREKNNGKIICRLKGVERKS